MNAFVLPDVPPVQWPTEFPDHLSASSLAQAERCPEQWRRRYVLGEKEAPSGAMVWGTVDGKAHGVNFTQKILSHRDITVDDLQMAFAVILDEEIDERGGPSEIDWRDDDPAGVKDKGVALVAQYHRQVSPRIQPTSVEEKFSLDLPGVPVPFIGYVDVGTEQLTIERKTAKAKSSTIAPQYRFQTLAYALARSRPVEVHISTRTIKPAVWTPEELPGLTLDYTPSLTGRAEKMIAARTKVLLSFYDTFGPDETWPDAIGTMAWNMPICDMCGWGPNGKNTCAWWQ